MNLYTASLQLFSKHPVCQRHISKSGRYGTILAKLGLFISPADVPPIVNFFSNVYMAVRLYPSVLCSFYWDIHCRPLLFDLDHILWLHSRPPYFIDFNYIIHFNSMFFILATFWKFNVAQTLFKCTFWACTCLQNIKASNLFEMQTERRNKKYPFDVGCCIFNVF